MWRDWIHRPKGPSPEMQQIVDEVRELAAIIREETECRRRQGPALQKRDRTG